MLTFHFLNVGHGSSIVVEYLNSNNADRAYGVIDSNKQGDGPPKALSKLQELGAKKLSFLCMTHPHADHFSGLFDIVTAFSQGGIDHFYTCPMGELLLHRPRLKKLGEKLVKILNTSDGLMQRRAALELMQIFYWADTGAKNGTLEWRECCGESSSIAPSGFDGVDVSTMLPPNRMKGTYVPRIERGDMSITGTFQENEISLAIQFSEFNALGLLGPRANCAWCSSMMRKRAVWTLSI